MAVQHHTAQAASILYAVDSISHTVPVQSVAADGQQLFGHELLQAVLTVLSGGGVPQHSHPRLGNIQPVHVLAFRLLAVDKHI